MKSSGQGEVSYCEQHLTVVFHVEQWAETCWKYSSSFGQPPNGGPHARGPDTWSLAGTVSGDWSLIGL